LLKSSPTSSIKPENMSKNLEAKLRTLGIWPG
jgi:hypothetical protein